MGHLIEHLELPISNIARNACYFFRGVLIFFAISGMLIWFSINNRSKSYRNYLGKRFLRIYPELWGAVIVDAIIILLLYKQAVPKDLLLFSLGQGTILQFWTPNSLRGYGVGTPNGALWTIGIMIQFYIVAWPISKILKGKKKKHGV